MSNSENPSIASINAVSQRLYSKILCMTVSMVAVFTIGFAGWSVGEHTWWHILLFDQWFVLPNLIGSWFKDDMTAMPQLHTASYTVLWCVCVVMQTAAYVLFLVGAFEYFISDTKIMDGEDTQDLPSRMDEVLAEQKKVKRLLALPSFLYASFFTVCMAVIMLLYYFVMFYL